MLLHCLITAKLGSWEGKHALTLNVPPPYAWFECKGKWHRGLSCVTLPQPYDAAATLDSVHLKNK